LAALQTSSLMEPTPHPPAIGKLSPKFNKRGLAYFDCPAALSRLFEESAETPS